MVSRSKTITIEKCPKCQGSHRYSLEIERNMIPVHASSKKDNVPTTLILTCPVTNEIFQVVFVLHDQEGVASSIKAKREPVVSVPAESDRLSKFGMDFSDEHKHRK